MLAKFIKERFKLLFKGTLVSTIDLTVDSDYGVVDCECIPEIAR